MSENETPAGDADATHFRAGDVWMSPAGKQHCVERVNKTGSAFLRRIVDGRGVWRQWDAIGAHSGRPWIRESWGGQP